MSKTLIALVGAAAIAGLAFPSVFQRHQAALTERAAREEVVDAPRAVEAALPAARPAPVGRVAELKADADGHFRTQARLNGRATPVLVDTGASYLSLGETDARRLGIVLQPADFRFTAETANGQTRVALATLARVAIGRVELRDVEVMVSRGDVLPITLLGMSFLGRLQRFGVEGDTLRLVQ